MVYGRLLSPVSIFLLAAIWLKLIGPHDRIQVDKEALGSMDWSCQTFSDCFCGTSITFGCVRKIGRPGRGKIRELLAVFVSIYMTYDDSVENKRSQCDVSATAYVTA